MKISVVMTVYNGEKYIIDQLDSLKNQTREIDEVLIFDDGSSDTSKNLILTYISENNLQNWRYCLNIKNKGWKRNFQDGVKAAIGDLVFPCDQDDIWHLDKIEKMERVMINNPDINVLVGRYHKFFDDNEKQIIKKKTLWENFSLLTDKIADRKNNILDESIDRIGLDNNLFKLMPGCCFCIRKDFFNKIEPFWFPELGHDAFYTFFSKLTDSYAVYNYYVIEWRHHMGSTSRPMGRQKSVREKELYRNHKIIEVLKSFLKTTEVSNSSKKMDELEKFEHWCNLREDFLKNRNPVRGLELLSYAKYYERNRAIITDWLYTYMK